MVCVSILKKYWGGTCGNGEKSYLCTRKAERGTLLRCSGRGRGERVAEKEFFGSLAGMKIFRTFALTSPPEGLEMLKREIIDIKIRQGHRPS